jgi:2-polyprenyl-3-methyl-5-hydroxy-6-metoxy-1,4-benzoquinol methylase
MSSMLAYLRKATRQEQTLSSFDYQWRNLPDGDAMLSDPWFDERLTDILAELAGVRPEWFRGKRVLDAGCGGGRWSVALARLGAKVTAIDFSEAGLERTRALCEPLGEIETMRVNLLDPPEELRGRRFDMVYSYGVLHHTGDTFGALANVVPLVADDGLLFLYLYGVASWPLRERIRTNYVRLRLAGLSFDEKIEALRRFYPDRDPHQAFDLLSPTINDRLTFDEVKRALEGHGFVNVVPTVESGEVCLRAERPGFKDRDALTPGRVPEEESLYWGHLHELERVRRDVIYERRFWAMAENHSRRPARDVAPLLAAAGLGALEGRTVLVASPESREDARALASAGARVTLLDPAGRDDGDDGRLVASTLDEAAKDDERFDVVLALGSAVAISRRPERAIRALASRLAPGGSLVVETLAPEPETSSHRVRRLALKPYGFEQKIERLLKQRPESGLDGAFALLSSGLPLRRSAEALEHAMRDAKLEEVRAARDGAYTIASGRRAS